MKKLKINDIVELLIDDIIYKSKVSCISTRETDREIFTYYHLENLNSNDIKMSITIDTVEYKEDD